MSFQKKFSYLKKVIESDIDNLNHVNNIEYLKWVQKASTLHWESLSNKELNKKFLWVVLRHEIDYLNGKIFLDYLPKLKAKLLREKMMKFIKNGPKIKPHKHGKDCGASCGHDH